MNQIERDLDSPVPTDFDEQQKLPDDVLEALGAGRLTDINYLGSGATSSVFSAHDSGLDKRVAIKFLKHGNDGRLIDFQSEAKLASQLSHGNPRQILNFGVTTKNHAFLIMDFVDGKSLETILEENGPIPPKIAVRLLMQICDGLEHAHSKKIAHRDLKTANILVQGYGTNAMNAIVVDFGLALQRQSQENTNPGSHSGKIKGSPLFISPEQAQGKPGGESSDIYSLGCIAFNLLTGTLPFEADDLFELLKMHIKNPAPTLAECNPDAAFPPALEKCVQRMLEKNPEDRFQNILEVEESLSRSIKQRTPLVQPASHVVQKKFRRSVSIIVCIAALVASLGVIWFIAQNSGSTVDEKNETPQEKYDRLFKYDSGNFLSHFGRRYICPKVTGIITDEDLECLAEVNLPTPDINLAFTNISGTGLAKLSHINGLKLDLSKTEMTEEGFKTIGTLQNLDALSLNHAKLFVPAPHTVPKITYSSADKHEGKLVDISRKEIIEITRAKNIFELNLDMCNAVDDGCMELIATLPLLAFTARDAGKITDKGVVALAKCVNVKMVHLDGNPITDKAAEVLSVGGKLVDFRGNRCREITSKTLQTLCAKNPQLQFVGLSFTKTTTKDLHLLEGRDLKFLEILGIPVGPDEMRMFGQMRNMEYLYISKVQSAESLKYLYNLPRRPRVMIMDSKALDAKSVAALQTHLPETTIVDGTNRAIRADVNDFQSIFLEGSKGGNPFD